MKIKLFFANLFFFLFFFSFFLPQSAFADTFTVSGRVTSSSGNDIANASISVTNSTTGANAGSTTTDTSGNYSLVVMNGVYNVQVTPPAGNGFSPAIALSQTVSANKVLNFILTPAGSVTFSGRMLDSLNNPVPSQTVKLVAQNGSQFTSVTDSFGNYTLQVTPGTYILQLVGNRNSLALNVPQNYTLTNANYSLTQSTLLDIVLPTKKVDVRIQDASGNSVNNVEIKTNTPGNPNLSIGGNITVTGQSNYGVGFNLLGPKTNASGDATLWLFPTDATPYTFTAIPPSGSNFGTTTLPNVTFTTDTQKTITLQQSVVLSGHIYDPLGNPVPNQTLFLESSGGVRTTTTTNTSGSYSLQVSNGTYLLQVNASNNSLSLNAPRSYFFNVSNLVLTQSQTLDITLPAKKVIVNARDAFNNPVPNVEFATNNPINGQLSLGNNITASGGSNYGASSAQKPKTDSSGKATLWLFPTATTSYTITAIPPSGSAFGTTTLSNVSVVIDSEETIIMPQPVILSGKVIDPLGNPVPNQTVYLQSSGDVRTTTNTNSLGNYSLQVTAGNYTLVIQSPNNNNPLNLNVPQSYNLVVNSYVLASTTSFDITIPVKKVDIHVQDAMGNPVEDIEIRTNQPNNSNLPIGSGVIASGISSYGTGFNPQGPKTDTLGNTTLWLYPTSNTPYSFTAIPLVGGVYSPFILSNIAVTGNQTEVISLQYNHDTPLTTATLETQNADGTYSNPTIVTLSASATEGYTVANTYYKVDGGVQQIYTSPFTVTGDGEHSIEYWSVDNSGVQEAHFTESSICYCWGL